MATLSPYKGLLVVNGASGAGGEALTDNFVLLADRAPYWDSSNDPTVDNDTTEGFDDGSLWLNQSDNTFFLCLDPTEGAAVWRSLFKRDSTTLSLAPDGDGAVAIGNLSFSGNTLSSSDTNGNILLAPNGSGNVGIGTSSPDRLLSLASDSPRIRLTDNTEGTAASATGVIEFFYEDSGGTQQLMSYIGFTSSSDANLEIRNALTGNLEFWTNGTQHMVLDSTGKLGIGTNPTPSVKLDVDGAIAIKDGMTAPTAVSGKAFLFVDSADGSLKVRFGDGCTKTITANDCP